MIGILFAKLKYFLRNPWTFIIFTGMTIALSLVFGGFSGGSQIKIPIYADHSVLDNTSLKAILQEEDAFQFDWMTEEDLHEKVKTGKAELGVILLENDFQLVVGVDSFNTGLVEQSVRSAYMKNNLEKNILEAAEITTLAEKEDFLNKMDQAISTPVFQVEQNSFRGEGAFLYDSKLHALFGFSLFFVIYTIAYNVLPILMEKRDGIWDRMILSPVKKWEMYVANLIYSFITGYIQVVIAFLVFRFVVGIDFHGKFVETLLLLLPYVFAIVSLSILLTALVKKVQQFNALLPIISVSMAMIGGAYWPIEVVNSKLLLALAKINPLTYGMEILQGATVYGYPMAELLFPISILILMGVMMMGVGIHLMERRHV